MNNSSAAEDICDICGERFAMSYMTTSTTAGEITSCPQCRQDACIAERKTQNMEVCKLLSNQLAITASAFDTTIRNFRKEISESTDPEIIKEKQEAIQLSLAIQKNLHDMAEHYKEIK